MSTGFLSVFVSGKRWYNWASGFGKTLIKHIYIYTERKILSGGGSCEEVISK